MSFELRAGHRVYVFNEPIDFRAGFDKLSMYVREKMRKKLVEGDLFLFLGKNRKRLKAICYDGTGLLLLAKRLERGRFMGVTELENYELTVSELNLVLSGGVIRRKYFGDEALTVKKSPVINLNHGAAHTGEERESTSAVHVLARGPG